MYDPNGKRAVDVVCSALALAALSPVIGAVSGLIWLEDRHSPLFRQERVGRHQVPFTIFKFRSMPVDTAEISSRDFLAPTVTRVGRVIRRLNIDELPQLVNILAGDMSVIGPRPALASQRELVAMREAHGVFRAAPGLTGLAQVESYDDMPDSQKVEKDERYVARITLWGDVKIILRTLRYLFAPPPRY